MKKYILLILVILLNSLVFILQKFVGITFPTNFSYLCVNIYFLLLLFTQGVIFVLWQALLYDNPLAILYPFLSLVYIIVPVAAYFIFGEEIEIIDIPGLLFIVFGVYLISSGDKNV